MKGIIINRSDVSKMLAEAAAVKAIGGKVYEDPAKNFIAVFEDTLFEELPKNMISGNAKIMDIVYIPDGWNLLEEKREKQLRRRIEDYLRKYATSEQMLQVAQILGVKTE